MVGKIFSATTSSIEKSNQALRGKMNVYQMIRHCRMTREEIGIFAYKHSDHHLRQFGAVDPLEDPEQRRDSRLVSP